MTTPAGRPRSGQPKPEACYTFGMCSARRAAAPVAIAITSLSACSSEEEPPRMDDLSALASAYERPERDLLGDVRRASLVLTQRGMTFEEGSIRDSIVFDEVACDGPKTCKVEGVGCVAMLEQTPDGDLAVHTERGCRNVAGLWYTKARADERARELAPPAPALRPDPSVAPTSTPSASSASPAPSGSTPPPASARALAPEPEPALSKPLACLKACSDTTMTCARKCVPKDTACTSKCNDAAFSCAVACAR